jgi:hypothetical protein
MSRPPSLNKQISENVAQSYVLLYEINVQKTEDEYFLKLLKISTLPMTATGFLQFKAPFCEENQK